MYMFIWSIICYYLLLICCMYAQYIEHIQQFRACMLKCFFLSFFYIEVRCPHLQTPNNGLINCSSEPFFNTSCFFSCLDGYQLHGHQMVLCSLNGNWTEEVPECQGKNQAEPLTERNINIYSLAEVKVK